ncbi:MAG TPA: DUF3553 domain-containing protein [Myxococcota bacterium]
MELHRNDRVKMPAKPEWGLGRVLQDPAAGKVSVHFREVGEKVLSLKHAQMEPVEGEAARDAWLDNVDPDSKSTPHYLGPREALSSFLEKYPGGLRDSRFLSEERQPLENSRALLLELLDRDAVLGFVQAEKHAEICDRALRVISKTNLVLPSDRMALARALKREENRVRFAPALSDLLYGDEDPDVRFKHFAAMLAAIGAAKWTLATSFNFLRYPEDHMVMRPAVTQQAAARCRFQLDYRPELDRRTYGRLLAFARVLCEAMESLSPVDHFDVQGIVGFLADVPD